MTNTSQEVIMPVMGEGIKEVTLVKWLKKVGDAVKKDEPLLEVSTDKVDTEIPSPADGFLIATYVNPGAHAPVNSTIAFIASDKNATAPAANAATIPGASAKGPSSAPSGNRSIPPPAAGAPNRSGAAAHSPARGTGVVLNAASLRQAGVKSSPLVRKMAVERGIDLRQVAGSGSSGRITTRDLATFVPVASGAVDESAIFRVPTQTVDGVEYVEGVAVRRETAPKMRQLIAEHMIESVRVSPHVTTVFEVDMHKVVAAREASKAAFEAKNKVKLTYTPYLIHAAVQAIKKHPIINVSLDGNDILWKSDINVGCAVAIETGLIVPVIKKAQDMSLEDISLKLNDLATRARSKKLLPDDIQGGTFSITNPGGFGSLTSNPIINQPQVAILGIGTIVKRPVVINDQIVIRPMMLMSLTFDHRVIDGEGGAKYLATMRDILESYS